MQSFLEKLFACFRIPRIYCLLQQSYFPGQVLLDQKLGQIREREFLFVITSHLCIYLSSIWADWLTFDCHV